MKPFWQSKIFWLNIISLLIEIGQMFLDKNILPAGTVLLVVNILNILLRFMTTKTLTGSPTIKE